MNFTTAAIINWDGKAARAVYIVGKVGVRGSFLAPSLNDRRGAPCPAGQEPRQRHVDAQPGPSREERLTMSNFFQKTCVIAKRASRVY